jgi:hypothetical protein
VGLTLRRARAATLALLLLTGAACTDDGRDEAAPAETTSTAPTTTTSPTFGGSRYLAHIESGVGDDRIVREDLADGTTATPQNLFDELDDVAVSPSGALAWTEILPQTDVTHVRFALTVDAFSTASSAPDAGCPAWLADGRLVVTWIHDDGTVALAEVDTQTGITEDLFPLAEAVCVQPAGPDHLVYPRAVGESSYGPGGAEVVRVRTDGSDEEVVGHVPPYCYANDLATSPDGRQLAAGVFCGAEALDDIGLYVGSLDDDLAPLVAEGPDGGLRDHRFQYWHPSWSADGTVIAYFRTDGGATPSRIFTVAAAGGNPEPRGPGGRTTPSFSGPGGG